MGRRTLKEKLLIFIVIVIIGAFLVWFFGIRKIQKLIDSTTVQRDAVQIQLNEYQQLSETNSDYEKKISALKTDITNLESGLIPTLSTQNLETYVMQTFEENGCPYLTSIMAEDVACDSVTLPDGTLSNDCLLLKRITVTYSTTDGVCVPEYNETPFWDAASANQAVSEMGTYGIVGYDEFIKALAAIESENPDCILISGIKAEDSGTGFILLTATIDFYGAQLPDRVSDASDYTNNAYASWSGSTDIDTAGGMIGSPLYCNNPDSDYYGVQIADSALTFADRPFAAGFSIAYFAAVAQSTGIYDADGNIQPFSANFSSTTAPVAPVAE